VDDRPAIGGGLVGALILVAAYFIGVALIAPGSRRWRCISSGRSSAAIRIRSLVIVWRSSARLAAPRPPALRHHRGQRVRTARGRDGRGPWRCGRARRSRSRKCGSRTRRASSRPAPSSSPPGSRSASFGVIVQFKWTGEREEGRGGTQQEEEQWWEGQVTALGFSSRLWVCLGSSQSLSKAKAQSPRACIEEGPWRRFRDHVTVNWEGTVMEARGRRRPARARSALPVTFPRRIGEPEGVTSPEEFIAAAHAAWLRDGAQRHARPQEREGGEDHRHRDRDGRQGGQGIKLVTSKLTVVAEGLEGMSRQTSS